MSADWVLTFAPVLGLAVDVVAQIAFAHLARRIGLSIVAGAAFGLVATAIVVMLTIPTGLGAAAGVGTWIVATVTFLALAFGYWAFVNLNITSLRIRMLREILRSPGGLSQAELMRQYSTEESLRRRLDRLENAGQLSRRDGRWRLESGTLLVLARTLEALRALLLPQRRGG